MRWMSRKRNGYKQRIWFGKSSCIELNGARCTARVTAALRRHMVRRAAHSFADLASAGTVEEAFPLAEFLALGQSVTLCPAKLQNRQSCSLKRRSRSSEVNLPFLPSLSAWGFFALVKGEDVD